MVSDHQAFLALNGLLVGRKFSAMEVMLVRSCGHVMSRRVSESFCCSDFKVKVLQHCFRSESLDSILLQVLVATDGGVLPVTNFLIYDRACSLVYYMAGLIQSHRQKVLQTRGDHGRTCGKFIVVHHYFSNLCPPSHRGH